MKANFKLSFAPSFIKSGFSGEAQNIDGFQRFLIFTNKQKSKYVIAGIRPKDLELFAVNILKSINSKRVLQGKVPYYKLKK